MSRGRRYDTLQCACVWVTFTSKSACMSQTASPLLSETWAVYLWNLVTTAQADLWTPMREVAEQAWVLWELLVLAQPLLVVAPSPGAPAPHRTASLCARCASAARRGAHHALLLSLNLQGARQSRALRVVCCI